MTLQYVKDRKAFGRPIGSYQALKHRLVDMLLWLESSKAVTLSAVKAVQFDVNAANSASMAKAYVADRCPVIVRECLANARRDRVYVGARSSLFYASSRVERRHLRQSGLPPRSTRRSRRL